MKARTLIFTGDGKGKTTAAIGMAIRAAGHGQRVFLLQFLKSNADSGELAACARFEEIEAVQMGCGFVPAEDDPAIARHREVAGLALERAKEAVRSGNFDLIILDEICGAISKKLIPEAAVRDLINDPARLARMVLTGRHASPTLIAEADTVTEMVCIRHGFAQGIPAQEGVEF